LALEITLKKGAEFEGLGFKFRVRPLALVEDKWRLHHKAGPYVFSGLDKRQLGGFSFAAVDETHALGLKPALCEGRKQHAKPLRQIDKAKAPLVS